MAPPGHRQFGGHARTRPGRSRAPPYATGALAWAASVAVAVSCGVMACSICRASWSIVTAGSQQRRPSACGADVDPKCPVSPSGWASRFGMAGPASWETAVARPRQFRQWRATERRAGSALACLLIRPTAAAPDQRQYRDADRASASSRGRRSPERGYDKDNSDHPLPHNGPSFRGIA
jgi:hypothetical protein